MTPNDLLHDAGGFGNTFRRTLKFEEKGVLDRIGFLDDTGCVNGGHHCGAHLSDEHCWAMVPKQTMIVKKLYTF